MTQALLRNTGAATLGVLVQGAARFLYTVLIGRYFGADSLGQISGLLALAVFVSLFWASGSGVAASRFIPRDRLEGHSGSPSAGVLNRAFLLSVPMVAIGTYVASWIMSNDPWIAGAACLLSVSFSAYAYTRGAGLGAGSFVKVALLDMISSFVSIGLLLLVVAGKAEALLLLPLTIGYMAFAVACWPRVGKERSSESSSIIRFVSFNSIAQIATGGLLQIAMLTAQLSDTPLQAGLFAAAFSLATPASMIGLSINQVLIPHLTEVAAAGSSAVSRATVTLSLITAAGLALVFGILILTTPLLLQVLYGSAFAEAADYMRWMLLFVWIYSIALVPAATLISTGRDRQYTVAATASFVAGFVVMLATAAPLGAWAAVVGFGAGTVLSALAIGWFTFRPQAESRARIG